MTTELICRDTDCTHCGETARRLVCADCGAEAIVTNCGHKSQPRPIAGSAWNGQPVCGPCEDARDEAAKETS
jgi:hypothetical protein